MEGWEPQGTGGSVAQHPRGCASTQAFHQPRAKIPMPSPLGKPEHIHAMHGLGPPVMAPCAPLTVLLRGQQEDAWKGRVPDVHPAPWALAWWDKWHPCPWRAAESPWAALALSLYYEKACVPLAHLCDPLPGGQARERGVCTQGLARRMLQVRCPLPDRLPLGTGWQGNQGPCWQQQVPVGTRGHHQLQAGDGQTLCPNPWGLSEPGILEDGFLSPRENGEVSPRARG